MSCMAYLIIMLVVIPMSYSVVQTTATVANEYPSIYNGSTYLLYLDHLDNVEESEFVICDNQESMLVFYETTASDPNGMFQVLNYGEVEYIITQNNGIEDLTFDRFGTKHLNMDLQDENSGLFKSSFAMKPLDEYLVHPQAYHIHSRVYDGAVTVDNPDATSFSFRSGHCQAYYDHSILFTRESLNKVSANDVEVDLMMIVHKTGNASIAIIRSRDSPVEFMQTDALVFYYYDILTTDLLDDYVSTAEIRFYYTQDEINDNNIYESSLELYKWDGTIWRQVKASGVDIADNYVYALVEELDTYAIFGQRKHYSTKCIEDWQCTSWSGCLGGRIQVRSCYDNAFCKTEYDKPIVSKSCISGPVKSYVRRDSDSESELEYEQINKNVSAQSALFDINIELLPGSVVTKKDLSMKVTLLNFGKPGLVAANISYMIYNDDGFLVFEEHETVPVETQVEYLKDLSVSKLSNGNYTLLVDLKYLGQKEPAVAAKDFMVYRQTGTTEIFIISFLAMLGTLGALYVITGMIKKDFWHKW